METKKTQIKRKFVSLAEARPDLAKEWNYEKNGDLRPEMLAIEVIRKFGGFVLMMCQMTTQLNL